MISSESRFKYTKEDEFPTDEQRRLKKDVVARIKKARGTGISTARIARQLGDGIYTVYDMLGAVPYPMSAWRAMDKALKELGC